MRFPIRHLGTSVFAFSLFSVGVSFAQTTGRVSLDSLGAEGNRWSFESAISADGRYVAFESEAGNLVPGDTNWEFDIFVHDRQTGRTERVNVDSLGAQANDISDSPSISANGRYVAFTSWANNLVPGDTNHAGDAFIHDRQTGLTERVSVDSVGTEGDGPTEFPSISADGRYVAFVSGASNFVLGDTNNEDDIFVHDRQTGVTERVSVSSLGAQAGDTSDRPTISADGRYVAFDSVAENLVPGDGNNSTDIFVHDRQTGVTERVSVDSFGTQATYGGYTPSISADGRYVAFHSQSSNLVPGDANNAADVFIHDRFTGDTKLVSLSSAGVQGDRRSFLSSISANGRYVAFQSQSSNLVPGDLTNLYYDIFVHDCWYGATERVSVNSLGTGGNSVSETPNISADGRYVAFESLATNFVPGDGNNWTDIFVHDRWDGFGANSIYLTGPSTSPVGMPISFNWQTTRGNSQYLLAYSLNMNGAVIFGHSFDIGGPANLLAMGRNSENGMGSFTSAGSVPPSAAGLTVYFEVAARDAQNVIYDSNVHAVTFH